MRMYDLIEEKKRGGALSDREIAYMIQGFTGGEIPDYQMAAMLMAIYFQGMNDDEITAMTMEMARSGDMADLSAIEGIKVDKHSTGGVGDKTTLIIGPIVAACGVKVAKMSGRGLGHTGGTIDKLESIPGFSTSIPREEFFDIVKGKTGGGPRPTRGRRRKRAWTWGNESSLCGRKRAGPPTGWPTSAGCPRALSARWSWGSGASRWKS